MKMRSTIVFVLLLLLCSIDELEARKQRILSEIPKSKSMHDVKYGIEGHEAPELSKDIDWVDASGLAREAIQLADLAGKYKVIYGFQAWCPGCHSRGLPALKKMADALKDNDQVVFLAIQTVFEGSHANTKERMLEIQKKYELHIPFGHDVGSEATGNRSSTMYHYRTGGTPWFIFIDQNDRVVFNDFHVNEDKAIEFLKTIK